MSKIFTYKDMVTNITNVIDSIRAGRRVEDFEFLQGQWTPVPPDYSPADLVKIATDYYVRIRPSFVEIAVRYPAPIQTSLAMDQQYFAVSYGWTVVWQYTWRGAPDDNMRLRDGVIHLTRDNADKHLTAIRSVRSPYAHGHTPT